MARSETKRRVFEITSKWGVGEQIEEIVGYLGEAGNDSVELRGRDKHVWTVMCVKGCVGRRYVGLFETVTSKSTIGTVKYEDEGEVKSVRGYHTDVTVVLSKTTGELQLTEEESVIVGTGRRLKGWEETRKTYNNYTKTELEVVERQRYGRHHGTFGKHGKWERGRQAHLGMMIAGQGCVGGMEQRGPMLSHMRGWWMGGPGGPCDQRGGMGAHMEGGDTVGGGGGSALSTTEN